MSLTSRKSLNAIFRFLLVAVAIAPLGYAVLKQWPALAASIEEVRWEKLVLGFVFLVPVILAKAAIPWTSLQMLGVPFSFGKSARIYFFTQIFKYLPGGIWAFPGRMAVYQYLRVDRTKSVVSVFREVTAEFLGAAIVGLVGVIRGLALSTSLQSAIIIGVLGSVAVVVVIQTDWFWRRISSFRLFTNPSITAYMEADPKAKSVAWLPRAVLVSVVFWLLLGFPIRQIALALVADGSGFSWLDAASMFALAWSAGFVIVLIPAGIGVREGAFAYLLNTILPVGAALSLALIMRVAWIFADGFWILFTLIRSGTGDELSGVLLSQIRLDRSMDP